MTVSETTDGGRMRSDRGPLGARQSRIRHATRPPGADGAVVIEPMRRRHLRAVHRIEEATNPHPWSMALFASELNRGDDRIYRVAHVDRQVVGYAGLLLLAGDGHVANVGVDADHRRQGIASRLLIDIFRRAIADGITALTLEVRTSNTAAQELYRRFEFEPAGVRRRYYTDNGEDALVMWATDVAGVAYRDRLLAIEDALDQDTQHRGST